MRYRQLFTFLFIAAIAYVALPRVYGQQPQAPPDMTIDAATRNAVIDVLLKELNDSYVFAETAKKMESDIRGRISAKEYDNVTSAREFASKLTADLQSVSKDKHLRVRYSFEKFPDRKDRREPTADEVEQGRWFNRRVNYGFERVERMNGNIGYIDLRGFNDHEAGAETVAAAMAFLQNTEALIFDLRQNGGGSPAMIHHRAKSPLWKMTRPPGRVSAMNMKDFDRSSASGRLTASFEYVGPARPKEAAMFGV